MATTTGGLLPWITRQFFDANGVPLSLGTLTFYEAGTTTPLDTFSDANNTPGQENPNPMTLDASGYTQTQVFLQPTGYDVLVHDADGNEIAEYENIEDVGQVFATNFGIIQTEGSTNVTSGYTVLVTDRLVTVDSTGGADPCVINLPPSADANQMVTIKNLGNIALAVTPDGAETVDSVAAAFSVDAAVSPTFPSIILVPDGVSSWWILASHGLA
jgi:hypothetical protein